MMAPAVSCLSRRGVDRVGKMKAIVPAVAAKPWNQRVHSARP